MADVRLIRAEMRHCSTLAARMREIDQRECVAMGRAPKAALRHAVATSHVAWTATVDGRPEAMFGMVVESALDRRGTPWFLGTDEVYHNGRALLTWGRSILGHMGAGLLMENFVSDGNHRAIRLLRKWGFTVDEERIEVRGMMFCKFWRAG